MMPISCQDMDVSNSQMFVVDIFLTGRLSKSLAFCESLRALISSHGKVLIILLHRSIETKIFLEKC